MKNLIFLSTVLFLSFNVPLRKAKHCSALDFMHLKKESFRKQFFSQLDSVRKVQYPNDDQEKEIMVDLSPQLLVQFLDDIDQDSLVARQKFEKDYFFNIAPADFEDSQLCKDKISISFSQENCRFRMVIFNTFLVETNWCTESQVVYGFDIHESGISNFWRNEAG